MPQFFSKTDSIIDSVQVTENEIIDIVKSLHPDEANGWDELSIRIIKLFGKPLTKPLLVIFQNCIHKGFFMDKWIKANVIPIFKKDKKHLIQNYCPISLLLYYIQEFTILCPNKT